MNAACRSLALLICLLVPDARFVSAQEAADAPVVTITYIRDGVEHHVSGRIVIEAVDGGLLVEESSGRLEILKAAEVRERTESEEVFRYLSSEQIGTLLQQSLGPAFAIRQTEHYVICSNSNDEYTQFTGKLLERVEEQYQKQMRELEVPVTAPVVPLPVIIFASMQEFQEYAKQQHPETDFSDTPGYYSVRENQILLQDLTQDRSIRSISALQKKLATRPLQLATVVHEAVHQLAFNTGLQVRMAHNPVWFSEGLASWFEPVSVRSSALWTKPGLVNGRYHADFRSRPETAGVPISFQEIISSDDAFLRPESVAHAYSESWGLTAFLIRQHPTEFGRYAKTLSELKPLVKTTDDFRVNVFREKLGRSPEEFEADVVKYVRKLRP